jgi:hypothetical protein
MHKRFFRRAMIGMALVTTAMTATSAQAALFGDSISVAWNFPGFGTNYAGFTATPSTFNVGGGVESLARIDGFDINIDFTDTSLTLTFLEAVDFNSAAFNGLVFTNNTDAFDSVLSITGGGTTTGSGNTLGVNLASVSFSAGQTVTINFADAVPEPATWALMIAGFGLVGAGLRHRRKLSVSWA